MHSRCEATFGGSNVSKRNYSIAVPSMSNHKKSRRMMTDVRRSASMMAEPRLLEVELQIVVACQSAEHSKLSAWIALIEDNYEARI